MRYINNQKLILEKFFHVKRLSITNLELIAEKINNFFT